MTKQYSIRYQIMGCKWEVVHRLYVDKLYRDKFIRKCCMMGSLEEVMNWNSLPGRWKL